MTPPLLHRSPLSGRLQKIEQDFSDLETDVKKGFRGKKDRTPPVVHPSLGDGALSKPSTGNGTMGASDKVGHGRPAHDEFQRYRLVVPGKGERPPLAQVVRPRPVGQLGEQVRLPADRQARKVEVDLQLRAAQFEIGLQQAFERL